MRREDTKPHIWAEFLPKQSTTKSNLSTLKSAKEGSNLNFTKTSLLINSSFSERNKDEAYREFVISRSRGTNCIGTKITPLNSS